MIERQCRLEQAESLLREVFIIVRTEREHLRRETMRLAGELLSA